MLIVNADDWGRSTEETDAAFRCFKAGRITSASAMVFMRDSERAALLANENGLDIGLHLNFAERFQVSRIPERLAVCQERIVGFLMKHRYSQLLFNPFLLREFAYSYEAQVNEFTRLYGRAPSHIDGHHHMHLCTNVVLSRMIPAGMKVRRNFSFWPGEKSWLNRAYRSVVDRWLNRRYRLTDFFFDLTQSIRESKLGRVTALAKSANVELMTHPVAPLEFNYLMSGEFQAAVQGVRLSSYALL